MVDKNQYDNIYQHIINNDDWTINQLFEDQLNLIEGKDEYYRLFIEEVVSPGTRDSKADIQLFVDLINELLNSTDEQLILSDYFEELPVIN